MVDPSLEEGHPTLTPQAARQGRPGRPMLWVLLISTTLVVIGFAALWGFHEPGLSGMGGQTAAVPDQSTSQLRQPRQTDSAPEPAPRS
jgi:hypothetical protein